MSGNHSEAFGIEGIQYSWIGVCLETTETKKPRILWFTIRGLYINIINVYQIGMMLRTVLNEVCLS